MIKSGYKIALNYKLSASRSGPRGDEAWWKKLWNLKISQKVKHFIWRAFHNILPTNFNLSRRGISYAISCPRCEYYLESMYHAILRCRMSMMIWKASNHYSRIKNSKSFHFSELCFSRQASLVVDDSFPVLREFQKFQAVNMVTSPRQASLASCWEAPLTSLLKLNVDIAFILSKRLAAMGGVVRDCLGIMIGGRSLKSWRRAALCFLVHVWLPRKVYC